MQPIASLATTTANKMRVQTDAAAAGGPRGLRTPNLLRASNQPGPNCGPNTGAQPRHSQYTAGVWR